MICKRCGQSFQRDKRSRLQYCPSCRAIETREQKKEWRRRSRQRERFNSMAGELGLIHETRNSAAEISQLAQAARAAGMSYGQYVALVEGQGRLINLN